MKKPIKHGIAAILCAFLVTALSACGALSRGNADALRVAVLLCEEQDKCTDIALLQSALGEDFAVETYTLNAISLPEKARALVSEGVFALYVVNTEGVAIADIVSAAKDSGTAVIVTGAPLSDAVLDSYDKLWYMGANEQQGAELLGVRIGNAFKSGELEDKNADGILNIFRFDAHADSPLKSTIDSAADLGVFAQADAESYYCQTAENSYISAVEAFYPGCAPDLILCYGEKTCAAVAKAAEEKAVSSPIVCVGGTALAENTALCEKLLYYTVYPAAETAKAAAAYLVNIQAGETVTHGTAYTVDAHKRLLFTFTVNA